MVKSESSNMTLLSPSKAVLCGSASTQVGGSGSQITATASTAGLKMTNGNNGTEISHFSGGKSTTIGKANYIVYPPGYEEVDAFQTEVKIENHSPQGLQELQGLLRQLQNLRFQVDVLQKHGTPFLTPPFTKGIELAVKKAKKEINTMDHSLLNELSEYYLQRNNRLRLNDLSLETQDEPIYASPKYIFLGLIKNAELNLNDVDSWRNAVGYYGDRCDGGIIDLNEVHMLLEKRVQEIVDKLCELEMGTGSCSNHCCLLFKKFPKPFPENKEAPLPNEILELLGSSRYSVFKDNLQERFRYMKSPFMRKQMLDLDQLIHQYPCGVSLGKLKKIIIGNSQGEILKNLFNNSSSNKLFHDSACSQVLYIPNNKVGNLDMELPLIAFPKCQEQKSSLVVSIVRKKYYLLNSVMQARNVSFLNVNDSGIVKELKCLADDWEIGTVEDFVRFCLDVNEAINGEDLLRIYCHKIIQETKLKSGIGIISYVCKNSSGVIQEIKEAHFCGNTQASSKLASTDPHPPLRTLPKIQVQKFNTPNAFVRSKLCGTMENMKITHSSLEESTNNPGPECVEPRPLPRALPKFRDHKFFSPDFKARDNIVPPCHIQQGVTLNCKVVSICGHNQLSIQIKDDKLPQSTESNQYLIIPCRLRNGKFMTDPNETKMILESIVDSAKELQAKFHGCIKDHEPTIWEISLMYRENTTSTFKSTRNTVQRILAKRRSMSLQEEELSDIDLF